MVDGDPQGLMRGGMILSFFGAMNSAIGTFFDLSSQRSQLKSQALSYQHQQRMSAVQARMAEMQAIGIEHQGRQQLLAQGLQAGQEQGRRIASQGASGIAFGEGSSAEARASANILAKIDRYNIESNIARAMAAAKTQEVDIRNQGLLAGVSAQNLLASARTINPYVGLGTSLLSDVGTLAREWRYAQRRTA